jgi:hypothetical protein
VHDLDAREAAQHQRLSDDGEGARDDRLRAQKTLVSPWQRCARAGVLAEARGWPAIQKSSGMIAYGSNKCSRPRGTRTPGLKPPINHSQPQVVGHGLNISCTHVTSVRRRTWARI